MRCDKILRVAAFLGSIPSIRGGAADSEESEDTEDDVKDKQEEEYDEYDSSDNESDNPGSKQYDVASEEVASEPYLEPYFMSPSVQLYATFGCMILSKKIDLFSPLVVKLIRLAFILQILLQQVFILYVRLAAKSRSDKTAVQVRNPMSDGIISQFQLDGSTRAIVKKLLSSFLSSETSVMEYDLRQASKMQGGTILNMGFMWILHFKLEKVQPLLIHICMGFLQLIYSPLFQIYILHRNLERPFKTPSGVASPTFSPSNFKENDRVHIPADTLDDNGGYVPTG